jgi:hypothetical protein
MIIANPIYDVVFKQLMQNSRIASFFISTLLGETVLDVDLKPQEFVYTDETKLLAVSRYDFIATIKSGDGQYKKALIEIQKAKNATDLMRFRKYLGEQYKKEDEVYTDAGKVIMPLPIVTIYLLGFDLPGIDSAAIKVARTYTDLLTQEQINRRSDFIEKLSHDCYVVQLSRIHVRVRSVLEEMLSVFEQDHFVDEYGITKQYDYNITNDVVKSMVEMLNYVGTDPARKREIEDEQEAWRTIDALGGDKLRATEQKLIQAEQQLQLKERALGEEKKINEQNKQALEQMGAALQTLMKEMEELKKKQNPE